MFPKISELNVKEKKKKSLVVYKILKEKIKVYERLIKLVICRPRQKKKTMNDKYVLQQR